MRSLGLQPHRSSLHLRLRPASFLGLCLHVGLSSGSSLGLCPVSLSCKETSCWDRTSFYLNYISKPCLLYTKVLFTGSWGQEFGAGWVGDTVAASAVPEGLVPFRRLRYLSEEVMTSYLPYQLLGLSDTIWYQVVLGPCDHTKFGRNHPAGDKSTETLHTACVQEWEWDTLSM